MELGFLLLQTFGTGETRRVTGSGVEHVLEDGICLVTPGLARAPFFAGHRGWCPAGERAAARGPFGAAVDRFLTEAEALGRTLAPGARVTVTGDASGWAAAAAAAALPAQQVTGAIRADGPLGRLGCDHWFAGPDTPANLAFATDAGSARAAAAVADATINFGAAGPGPAQRATAPADPAHLHTLIDPDRPVDLHRARVGERLLSDGETKVLYWASRAASVARTAERMDRPVQEIARLLAGLEGEGIVRVRPLPAAMARLHVFYSSGVALAPASEQTLGAVAEFAFRHFADRVFARLADDGSAISYGEAARLIARIAGALHRDGIRAGDHVAVHAIVHIEVALIFWACVHLGAVFVPIGSIWSARAAGRFLDRCRPKLLFINDEAANRVPESWRANAIRLDPAGRSAGGEARQTVLADWLGETPAPEPAPATHARPDDTAVILFTSGSTGDPKAVEVSNLSVVSSAALVGQSIGMTCDDVFLTVSEYTAASGFRDGLVTTAMCGASFVVADPVRRGNVLGLAELCRDHDATILRTFPAALRRLGEAVDRVAPDSLAGLRLILSSCATLHQKTLDRLGRLCTVRVMDRVGATETGGPMIFTAGTLERSSVAAHGGVPAHGVVAQAIDEAGRVIRDGAIGRLRIYSERAMTGYLDDQKRTAEVICDGWVHTGDMVQWDGGRLRIAGRAVEIIKSAWGDLVLPSEIEAALMGDERVREVAVCGFTDREGSEQIAAFVIPDRKPDDPDRLGEDFKTRVRQALGDSKVPRVVVLIEDMPRLAREKVDKRALARTYLEPGGAQMPFRGGAD